MLRRLPVFQLAKLRLFPVTLDRKFEVGRLVWDAEFLEAPHEGRELFRREGAAPLKVVDKGDDFELGIGLTEGDERRRLGCPSLAW